MRRWRSPVVLVACLGLAGCGGGGSSNGSPAGGSAQSTVSAAAYVKAVCGAVGPFERDIQARSSALNLSSIKSAAQGKAALIGFLNAVTGDTEKAVTELKAAGAPSVSGGSGIATAIVGAFTKLSGALTTATDHARSLPTGSPSAFRNGAVALGTEVRGSMGSIGAGLSGLRNAQLEAAAHKEPACAAIG